MNQGIIAMTPNIELEQQLLTTGSFRFCDSQTECGTVTRNTGRPAGVFWRHNDTPTNVVPVGWTHVPGMAEFTECPFCARSSIQMLGDDYFELEHDQIEVESNGLGRQAATGATNMRRQATPSQSSPSSNSSKSATPSLKKKPSKSKSKTPATPSDKELLANAKKMGMPSPALKAMKEKLKQNKRDKRTKRFLKFSPASYTPPSKSKSKSNTKKRKKTSPSKSKSQTKKARK